MSDIEPCTYERVQRIAELRVKVASLEYELANAEDIIDSLLKELEAYEQE